MSIIQTTIVATTDGTYGLTNNLIGQIKTIMLNDLNITIVSDNDPANSVARELVWTVGNNAHRYRITASSGIALVFALLGVDNITALSTSGMSMYVESGTACSVKLLYNSKMFAFYIESGGNPFFAVAVNIASAEWYAFDWNKTGAYINGSDSAQSKILWVSPYKFSDGSIPLAPIRFASGGTIKAEYHPYLFAYDYVNVPFGNTIVVLSDGTYNYLLLSKSGNSGLIVCDRVPA